LIIRAIHLQSDRTRSTKVSLSEKTAITQLLYHQSQA